MRGKLAIVFILGMVLGCIAKEQQDTKAADQKSSYVFATNEHLQKQLSRISKTHILSLLIESGLELSNEDLEIIGSFENLQSLEINSSKPVNGDFRQLSNLTSLTELKISTPQFTDADLAQLASLRNLESLHIGSSQVNGSGFAALTDLKSIRRLTLCCPVQDDAMEYISRLSNLESLFFINARVTDAGLMRMSENYRLVNIVASPHMTTEGLRSFRETLVEGRKKARAQGRSVPISDNLLIQVIAPVIHNEQ